MNNERIISEEEMEAGSHDGVNYHPVEIIEPNKFVTIVNESGLEQNKAQFLIEQFQDHFRMAAEWAKKAKTIIVTNENQTVNMKMARTGRLFLREKRLEIENARKSLKEAALKEGKAIDNIANFLKDLIIPTEEHLDRQEHFIEYKKKAEDERILAEAHAKMEAERVAKEQEDLEARARLQAENEKLRQANEEERKRANEIADALRKDNEEKLGKERAERLRVEIELRAKQQAEAKFEADRLREQERIANAGDTDLMLILRDKLINIKVPQFKSIENKRIADDIKSYIGLAIMKIKITVQEEEV